MKKLFALMMIAVAVSCLLVGCASSQKLSVVDALTNKLVVSDYEAAGRITGEACYYAYLLIRNNEKYSKYVPEIEALYAELLAANEADKENFDLGEVNKAILQVCRIALQTKYGYVKGGLIADGVNISGMIIDRTIGKKMTDADENKFMTALIETIKEFAANNETITKEFDKECLECNDLYQLKKELYNKDLTEAQRQEIISVINKLEGK